MWTPEHRLPADRSSLRYPSDLTEAEMRRPVIVSADQVRSGDHFHELREEVGRSASGQAAIVVSQPIIEREIADHCDPSCCCLAERKSQLQRAEAKP